jgi:hypothetical protein
MRCGPALPAFSSLGLTPVIGEDVNPEAQVVFVGKLGAHDLERRLPVWNMILENSKRRGARIFVDYTDHHLGFESPMAGFYRSALRLADGVIVPSHSMHQLIQPFWSGFTSIIEEPFENALIDPRKPEGTRNEGRRLLWFGHDSNMEYLCRFIDSRVSICPPSLEWHLVSNTRAFEIFDRFLVSLGRAFKVKYYNWSPDTVFKVASICDGAIIPSDPTSHRKKGASANRLVTSLSLGLPTAATRLLSYEILKDYFVDIDSDAIADFLHDPRLFVSQVEEAQAIALNEYSFEQISKKWGNLLLEFNLTQGPRTFA